jgi:hypothetical protein
MFNDILTGKATNELQPPPVAPHPAALPPVTHTCQSCAKPYTAPAQSVPGECPTCTITANAKYSAAMLHAAEESARGAERSHKMFHLGIAIVICAGIGAFKYGMKKQMREDAAQSAGYSSYSEYETERDRVYPTDDYSYRVNDLADEMCGCKDLACARDVQAKFMRFLRTGAPSDDKATASVDRDTTRLADCQTRIEGQ